MIKKILTDNGWINPNLHQNHQSITPSNLIMFFSQEWEADVKKMKQKFVDKHNENNKFISEVDSKTPSNFKENVVKIVDKSYLEKSSVVAEHANKINEMVLNFGLSKEQERAFQIVANHSVNAHKDQLKMYLGGMGGTGKSRVLAALSDFFAL